MLNQTQIFHSHGNGKLLISGEYLVLKGSKALAVPLKLGQDLTVSHNKSSNIIWESYQNQQVWQKVIFDSQLKVIECSNQDFANSLQSILKQCLLMSDQSTTDITSKTFVTNIDFNPNWGLGSSSTLIYNLARFFNINAHQLQLKTFNGSGYDVANAGINQAIIYRIENDEPRVKKVNFYPNFKDSLYFIYSGKKVSSRKAIANFKVDKISQQTIKDISHITELIAMCDNIRNFTKLIATHENIISQLLNTKPIQQEAFNNFNGAIKSLGTWGGDFFLACSFEPEDYVKKYFTNKGYSTIFNYDNLVLNEI